MLGLAQPLSSYVVRHSWASIAYLHHLDISLISKALGHTKSSTTFIYIKSLFDSDLFEANQTLMEDLGLFCAIARHETIRREEEFFRAVICDLEYGLLPEPFCW